MAHIWVAMAVFGIACLLGVWQMWARSPINAPYHTAANYFRSVTLHGVSMGYVLTTFFIMGFGYYVAETSLRRPLPSLSLAWATFWLGIAGA
jgi:cytochrome c oxidase subunit 1